MKRYLLLLPVIALGIFLFRPTDKPTQPVVATESVQTPVQAEMPAELPEFSADGIFNLVNQYRKENGLPELTRIPELDASAAEKCQQIIEGTEGTSGFDHVDPETGIRGIEIAHRNYGKTTYYSENLGRNVAGNVAILANWKSSPSHNAGMLDSRVTITGIGICSETFTKTSSINYAVQHFAQ